MSAIEGNANIKLTKNTGFLEKIDKSYTIGNNKNIHKNIISDLKQRFFNNLNKDKKIEMIRSILNKRDRKLVESKNIHNKNNFDIDGFKFKFEKNLEAKIKIKEDKQKLKFFWEHKYYVKNEYYKIYNALKEKYKRAQEFRNAWMRIINTYIVLSCVNKSHERKKEHNTYLAKIKHNYFKIWKKSKNTVEKINQQKKLKCMMLINGKLQTKYIFKCKTIRNKAQRIIKELLFNVYIVKQFDITLKDFALKGIIKS